MAKKPGGLGRDFYSILSDNASESTKSYGQLIRISNIEPRSNQPRKEFDEESLSALAASISEFGVLQPIIVRENPESPGFYEIIAGERRWRAARLAGLTEIPAIISESDDLKTAEVSLIENLQRQDLNPVEEAFAYSELMSSFGLTQEQVATRIGKSRSAIANTLRLLDLPDSILEMLAKGELSAGHARALLGLEHREDIEPLAERIKARQLSVRDVESAVKRINSVPRSQAAEQPGTMPATLESQKRYYMRDLERRSTALLGRRVRITNSGKKKAIEVAYNDDNDLEALMIRLCGSSVFDEE